MKSKNSTRQLSTSTRRLLVLTLLSSLTGFSAMADELEIQAPSAQRGTWEILKKKDDVQIAQRSVENSPFLETRGRLTVPINMLDALAVLRDVEACTQWLFDCKQGEVLSSQGLGNKTYYTVIDAPFTFKDRDSVIQSSLCYRPAEQTLNIKMRGTENALPLHDDRVRVLNFSGSWELQQRPDGQLDMTYQMHSDPQIGAKGAVNRTMRKSVRVTLRNVARLANTAAYVNSVPTDEEMAEITACESDDTAAN